MPDRFSSDDKFVSFCQALKLSEITVILSSLLAAEYEVKEYYLGSAELHAPEEHYSVRFKKTKILNIIHGATSLNLLSVTFRDIYSSHTKSVNVMIFRREEYNSASESSQ